jgi:hypothetical protein
MGGLSPLSLWERGGGEGGGEPRYYLSGISLTRPSATLSQRERDWATLVVVSPALKEVD